MANSYALFESGEPSVLSRVRFECSRSRRRRTRLGANFLFVARPIFGLSFRRRHLETGSASDRFILSSMRVDPKGTIAGLPALLVRDCLRALRGRISWNLATLEAASLEPGTGKSLVRALSVAGLVKSVGRGRWEITQA